LNKQKTKYKIINLIIVLWVTFVSVGLYNLQKDRIALVLESELQKNQIRYDTTYNFYKQFAIGVNNFIVKSKGTMAILDKINGATPDQLDQIRLELENNLATNYKNLKIMNLKIFHFHLKNNHSFLRMHKPDMYGDDLSSYRYGVKHTNETLKPSFGFESGRLMGAIRYIFPIIDDKKEHIGSFEISIKTDDFIDRMREEFSGEIEFLISKNVIDTKVLKSEIKKSFYISAESPNFYIESETKDKYNHLELSSEIKENKPFAIYKNKQIISFLPIKNIEGKNVAYTVIYADGTEIQHIIWLYIFLYGLNFVLMFVYLVMNRKSYLYKVFKKEVNDEVQYHRDTLQAIVYILNEFVTNNNFHNSVESSLTKIIEILNIDRVYIFENHLCNDELLCSQRYEFVDKNVSAEIDNPELQNISYDEFGIGRWKTLFEQGKYIDGLVKNFPDYEKNLLESQDIKSILVMPVWFEDKFWGFMGFDDCKNERVWHDVEKDVLKTFCSVFISALNKEKYSDNLQTQVQKQLKDLRVKDEQLLQQSKLAQMGDMISMIAHQWRQPLNTISASSINLSLLSSMQMLEDSKVQEDTAFIQNQCQIMSKTIDTFMNFVKPSKKSTKFYFKNSIDSILNIMGTQLANHNIEINVESVDDDLSMIGHEDLLEQVIINILSNARDAFEEISVDKKFINIKIDSKHNVPIITIEDNAGGVPKEIADKIFNPYFTTKEQGKGTGLGLYMSKDIMQKSFGGDLKLDILESGSRFTLVCGVIK